MLSLGNKTLVILRFATTHAQKGSFCQKLNLHKINVTGIATLNRRNQSVFGKERIFRKEAENKITYNFLFSPLKAPRPAKPPLPGPDLFLYSNHAAIYRGELSSFEKYFF
jgi:hypothetical protein